jgi:hypothetical protein
MTFSPETLSRLVLVAIGLAALALALSALASGRRRHNQEPVVVDEIQFDIEGAVRNVGLVRYDAFEDVGGRLSFSCALLDDRGTGVVMTSINGRHDTRVYAKPVSKGHSPYSLSIEEEEAIRKALESGAERAVTAT